MKDFIQINKESQFFQKTHLGKLLDVQSMVEDNPTLLENKTLLGNKLTPLMLAAYCHHQDLVAFFLEKGAKVNTICSKGWQAIHYAALAGHVDIVDQLYQQQSALNPVGMCTARELIKCAVMGGHVDAAISFKGTYNFDERNKVVFLLHDYALSPNANLLGLEQLLQAFDLKVNALDKEGRNVLHMAAFAGNFDFIQSVSSKHTIDLHAKTKQGLTLLSCAASVGHFEILKKLICLGFSPEEIKKSNPVILRLAAKSGKISVLDAILKEKKHGFTLDEILNVSTYGLKLEVKNIILQAGRFLEFVKNKDYEKALITINEMTPQDKKKILAWPLLDGMLPLVYAQTHQLIDVYYLLKAHCAPLSSAGDLLPSSQLVTGVLKNDVLSPASFSRESWSLKLEQLSLEKNELAEDNVSLDQENQALFEKNQRLAEQIAILTPPGLSPKSPRSFFDAYGSSKDFVPNYNSSSSEGPFSPRSFSSSSSPSPDTPRSRNGI